MIIHLGEWVLKTVCRKLQSSHEAGYFVKASVNMSVIQFLQTDLLEKIEGALQENKIEPKRLIIEITESAMIEQEGKVLEKVK